MEVEKSKKKPPFPKQAQAKTGLFTSQSNNGGEQNSRNKSGIPDLRERCI